MKTTARKKTGVTIKNVVPGSPADLLELAAGDTIVAMDSFPVHDGLSFRFFMGKPDLCLTVIKSDGQEWVLDLEQDPETPFGVDLEDDPIRLCRNKCLFCFVDQNPSHVRPSLKVKDEDIRLSFLYGNYTTLSSTDDEEEARIIRERLSPLYVSVHATDPALRVRLLRNKWAGRILQRMRRLTEQGIDFHTQIVLCPELNDGLMLRKTIDDLMTLHPHILSIAIVPLGLTGHRRGLEKLKEVTDAYCRHIVKEIEPVQRNLSRRFDMTLLFLGDEFYLRGGVTLPDAAHYLDFPQLENGIGMVRRFLDAFETAFKSIEIAPGCRSTLQGTLATGRLFGPVLSGLVDRLNRKFGSRVKVAQIPNRFYGSESITVTGLLTASDLVDELKGRELGSFLVIPDTLLNEADPPRFLDDRTLADLEGELGLEVHVCPADPASLIQLLARFMLP